MIFMKRKEMTSKQCLLKSRTKEIMQIGLTYEHDGAASIEQTDGVKNNIDFIRFFFNVPKLDYFIILV